MIDKYLLDRYLRGEGGLRDKATIKEWFSQMGEEKALREISMQYWEEPDPDRVLAREKAEGILDRIHHLIRLHHKSATPRKGTGLTRTLRVLSRIAAILFIPLAIYVWILRDQVQPSSSEPVYSEIVCPPGTRTMFHLSDGTRGWLNGGSSLEYPVEFFGKTREVRLSGEAFFDVKSSPKHPFIVHGEQIQVRAFGTSFNVMDYPDEQKAEVSLVEGNVDVHLSGAGSDHKLGSMAPGEVCFLNAETSTYGIRKDDIDKRIAWKEGKLIFRDDSFVEVVRKCNRWYNVDINIMDKALESYTYVGTFQDETLEEVLKLLSLTAPMKYIDKGRVMNPDGTFEKRQIELCYNR